MDDKESQGLICPWSVEEIPLESFLYRQVHFGHLRLPKPRRFPSEAAFALHQGEEGLSVYWDKYIDIKDIFLTIGLTHKPSKVFKEHKDFKIFKLQKGYLVKVDGISQVAHNPEFNGNPAPIGQPNIRAHSLVFYDGDDPQVRVVLSDYCTGNYNDCYCEFKVDVSQTLNELRERLNNTPFHTVQS